MKYLILLLPMFLFGICKKTAIDGDLPKIQWHYYAGMIKHKNSLDKELKLDPCLYNTLTMKQKQSLKLYVKKKHTKTHTKVKKPLKRKIVKHNIKSKSLINRSEKLIHSMSEKELEAYMEMESFLLLSIKETLKRKPKHLGEFLDRDFRSRFIKRSTHIYNRDRDKETMMAFTRVSLPYLNFILPIIRNKLDKELTRKQGIRNLKDTVKTTDINIRTAIDRLDNL